MKSNKEEPQLNEKKVNCSYSCSSIPTGKTIKISITIKIKIKIPSDEAQFKFKSIDYKSVLFDCSSVTCKANATSSTQTLIMG